MVGCFRKNHRLTVHELPAVGELKDFIQQELPLQITLPKQLYRTWLVKVRNESPELMSKLFQIDNEEPCVCFIHRIGSRFIHSMECEPWDSKSSFISFWDDLTRHVLNFVGFGTSNRDITHTTPTGNNRPDYLFLVDSICVLRGVEKGPRESNETARRELMDNFCWNYGDAPYLFGYTAVGFEIRLYVITGGLNYVNFLQVGTYYLQDVEGRFQWLLALLHMARMFRSLASVCPDSVRGEYQTLFREKGIQIHLEPSRICKFYLDPLFHDIKDHVQTVYKVLKDSSVPHVDRLMHVNENVNGFVFEPRGEEIKPANLTELFHALENVLEALVTLHAVSWMHRDIRWPNVMKRQEENSWFLIDFMDAAQSPQYTPSGQHLSRSKHAPEIFEKNGQHTTAVDVWSVGRLITRSGDEVYSSWYDRGGE